MARTPSVESVEPSGSGNGFRLQPHQQVILGGVLILGGFGTFFVLNQNVWIALCLAITGFALIRSALRQQRHAEEEARKMSEQKSTELGSNLSEVLFGKPAPTQPGEAGSKASPTDLRDDSRANGSNSTD